MRRRTFIGLALLALSHFAFADVSPAFAQAGSTGGTIGKQDKSISGVNDTTNSRRAATTTEIPGLLAQDELQKRSQNRNKALAQLASELPACGPLLAGLMQFMVGEMLF